MAFHEVQPMSPIMGSNQVTLNAGNVASNTTKRWTIDLSKRYIFMAFRNDASSSSTGHLYLIDRGKLIPFLATDSLTISGTTLTYAHTSNRYRCNLIQFDM